MNQYDEVFIYFDTNVLECRHSGDSLYLSKFVVSPLYYEIEQLIKDWELSDKVKICIPEIVWLEIQEHLISHFKSQKDSMLNNFELYRKSFGDLIELSCDFKDCISVDEYKEYLISITTDFLDNPRVSATIISCPKDEDTIDKIIKMAIHSERPFRKATFNKKKYTDAGFKDALIFNTIQKYTGVQLGIFISDDTDFESLFKDNKFQNLCLCKSVKDVKDVLIKVFNIVPTDEIEARLKFDEYLIKRILTETEFNENDTYRFININSIANENDGIKTDFMALVNGEMYFFEIMYNINANELLEASSELCDESEDCGDE